MSAFKVSDNHIRVLVQAACSSAYFSYLWRGKVRKVGLADRDRLCSLLATENDKSLRARYPDSFKDLGAKAKKDKLTFFPIGKLNMPKLDPIVVEVATDHYGQATGFYLYDNVANARKLYDSAQIYKAVQCYEYQSCEHDGWLTSEAHAICLSLRAYYGDRLLSAAKVLERAEWTI